MKTAEELRQALEKMRELYREATVVVPPDLVGVAGIFLGGCVERGVGSSFRAKGHAHNDGAGKFYRWICIRSLARLGEYQLVPQSDGKTLLFITKPSRLLMHEYAHVLTPGHSHDDTWRRKMRELGQPLPRQYQKKKNR